MCYNNQQNSNKYQIFEEQRKTENFYNTQFAQVYMPFLNVACGCAQNLPITFKLFSKVIIITPVIQELILINPK